MGDQVEGKWVVPNPQVPRTFGMMNLVFGILLLLMGVGYLALYVVMPVFQQKMVVQMKEQQETSKNASGRPSLPIWKKKEAAAKAKEAAAKTKEETEKAKEETTAVVEERQTFENSPDPDLSAVTDMMGWNIMSDRRLAVYYFTEVVSGMILNIVMIISGIGLLSLADWGRRLAITTAWLKILPCWVAMTIVTMVLVVPITAERTDKMFRQIQVQANAKSGGPPAGTPMVGLGQMTAIMSAVAVVFSAPDRFGLPDCLALVPHSPTHPGRVLARLQTVCA